MRKLTHPDSPVTQLKLLWRDTLTEDERDYWRDQFAGPATNQQIRQQITEKYQLTLGYDTQLLRFRRWVDECDAHAEKIQAEADAVAHAAAELQSLGLSPEQLRDALLTRMKTRALVMGDFDLACRAINLDLRVERNLLHQRRLDLQERRLTSLEKQPALPAPPGELPGLSPEIIKKIERELMLF